MKTKPKKMLLSKWIWENQVLGNLRFVLFIFAALLAVSYPTSAFSHAPAGHPDGSLTAISCTHNWVRIATHASSPNEHAWYHACQEIINHCGHRAFFPNPVIQVTGGLAKQCTISQTGQGNRKYLIVAECPSGDCSVDPSNLGVAETPNETPELDDLQDPPSSCPSDGEPMMNVLVGNPIDLGARNKIVTQADYRGVGIFPLDVTWRYNSRNGQWRHTYQRSLDLSQPNEITLVRHDGKDILYEDDGLGNWTSTVLSYHELVDNGSGWTLSLSSGLVEIYDTTGKLLSITNRAGLSQTLSYDVNGYLMSVTHPSGRMLTFTHFNDWGREGKVASVTDPAGNVFEYVQGVYWDLQSVKYPDDTPLDSSDNPQKSYQYYASGSKMSAITGITDELGNTYASYTYNWYMDPLSTELAGGVNKYTVSYASDGTATVTNPLGRTTVYSFENVNGARRMTSSAGQASTNCPASTASVTYDVDGHPNSATDRNGNLVNYSYSSDGEQTSRTEALGTGVERTISTSWHGTYRQPTQKVRDGVTESYTYNSAGQVLTRTLTDTTTHTIPYSTAGQTRTWTYTYNGSGQISTIDGPRTGVSDVTTFAYDLNHDLLTVTNALGQVTEITARDARGFPTHIEDENDVETILVYNERGRITRQTAKSAQGDAITEFAYNAANLLTRVTLPDNSFYDYEYDDAHRLVALENASADRIEYTLDNAGNITAQTIRDSGTTVRQSITRSYDEASRLIEVLGNNSQDLDISYDLNGNATSFTNALLHNTAQAFDSLDRLTTTTDPATNDTTFEYDPRDNITQVTDPRGIITTFVHDGFGQTLREASPDAGTTDHIYDAAGNLTQSNDARGVITQYSYDALNRITAITYPASPSENVNYTYDLGSNGIGRLSNLTDASGSTTLTYDDRGNVLNEVRVIGGISYTTIYGYTLADTVESMTYPSGRAVILTRDIAGRLSAILTQPSGGTLSAVVSGITYAPFGAPMGWTYGNGIVHTNTFDLDYRIDTLQSNGVLSLDLGYTAVDNIGTITNLLDSAQNQVFDYDALNRLTDATGGYGDIDYTYDAVGNRLTRSIIDSGGTQTETYGYAVTNNRLLSVQRDDNGLITNRALGYSTVGSIDTDLRHDGTTRLLVYNHRNRLANVADGGGTLGVYEYNTSGQRVVKTTNSVTTHFHYDRAGRLIAESDGTGITLQEYVYDDSALVAIASGSAISFVHVNHLGTPMAVTDATSSVVWSGQYRPFGEISASGSLAQPIRFPGQYQDHETGDFYNYYRSYDPSIGRYTQSDPIGLHGGFNTYGYAGGNPITSFDPFGLLEIRAEVWSTGKGHQTRYLPDFKPVSAGLSDMAKIASRVGRAANRLDPIRVFSSEPAGPRNANPLLNPKRWYECSVLDGELESHFRNRFGDREYLTRDEVSDYLNDMFKRYPEKMGKYYTSPIDMLNRADRNAGAHWYNETFYPNHFK